MMLNFELLMKSFFLPTLLVSSGLFSQGVVLDESYDDWTSSKVVRFSDTKGDGSASSVDVQDVRFTNDETFFYIYISTGKVFNIQSNNDLSIFVDIDNNPSTGRQKQSIGADLIYELGNRFGRIFQGSASFLTDQDDLDLVTCPTVTSDRFEIRIARKFFAANRSFSMANSIKVIIGEDTGTGDFAPNSSAYGFDFDNNIKASISPIILTKQSTSDLRFLSYNVLRDNLFDPSLNTNYKRIFNAIKPDIIGLCEIYDNNANATAAKIESFLPSSNGQKWYSDEVSPDIRIVSRYPIRDRISLDGNGVFVLDVNGTKVLYIVAHLPCCSGDNEESRQKEVDKIMGFVRNVRYGISSLNVDQNTPIVICGDMNLVGNREQQQTFMTGDIIYNNQFGPDFKPDWDGTNFEDAKPLTTNQASTTTWFDFGNEYSAGRLDYFFYSGSVLRLKNSYALSTNFWTTEQLVAAGLQKNDVEFASDHTPLVADFSFDLSTYVADEAHTSVFGFVEDNTLTISYLSDSQDLPQIINILGQKISLPMGREGRKVFVDISTIISGQIYFAKCVMNGENVTIRFVK
jgi:exonuclease III